MKISLEDMKNAAEANEYTPRSYSGRGMFGKECLGIECNNTLQCMIDMFHYLAGLVEDYEEEYDLNHHLDDVKNTLSDCSMDSMGRSYIVYWPDISWEE